ncbi:MAG: HAMP domain-containing protein [Polyangiales bacterium]|nr:HAMP domain-containing protein [Myxococcales bacterium]MCB9656309.1 HAMP domain-containing protein [Sandaracinaceae bacterium]
MEPRPSRSFPLAAKLVLGMAVVLAAAAFIASSVISGREWTRLVDAKVHTVEQIAALFAEFEAAAVYFGDADTLRTDIERLRETDGVSYGAVWMGDATTPDAELRVGPGAPEAPLPPAEEGVTVGESSIQVARFVRNPEGGVIGRVRIDVTLDAEVEAHQAAKDAIALFASVLGLAVALLLWGMLGRMVTGPLHVLGSASAELAQGQLAQVRVVGNDEVARLGHAFNEMAGAIRERETRIAETSARLQTLLDHMGQVILLFGPTGAVEGSRSRQADALIGDAPLSDIGALLYPEGSLAIERDAFRMWMTAVFEGGRAAWDELLELAPEELALVTDGRERSFAVLFRPVFEGERLQRVLFIGTDVTAQRELERSVRENERVHQNAVAAMRRLVAGGGQVFVRFLDQTRARLRHIEEGLRGHEHLPRSLTGEVFRTMHTLRAEARCFDLETVGRNAQSIETRLNDLRSAKSGVEIPVDEMRERLRELRDALTQAELLFVAQSPVGEAILDQITVRRSDLQQVMELIPTAAPALREHLETLAARPFGELVFLVQEATPRWCERAGIKAQIAIEGRECPVPASLSDVLGGVLSHLVRNAIAHGIEAPGARTTNGKPEVGSIHVRCERNGNGVRVVVEDDGAGVDEAKLRRMAESSGIDVTSMSLLELMSVAGLSSREAADDLSGQGVGMDAVIADLRAIDYHLTVTTQVGRGTQFILTQIERRQP